MPGKEPNYVGNLAERIVREIIGGKKPNWKSIDVIGDRYVEVKASKGKRVLLSIEQIKKYLKRRQQTLEGKTVPTDYAFVFFSGDKANVYFVEAEKLLKLVEKNPKHSSLWLLPKKRQTLLRAGLREDQSKLPIQTDLHSFRFLNLPKNTEVVKISEALVRKIAREVHTIKII